MSSADEEMRRLLDERGVEYMLDQRYRELFWDFGESGRARASAIGTKGLVQMIVTGLTPEQAIAATLGPRTCRKLPSSGETRCFVSRNGCEMEFGYWKCSNCGTECFEGAKYCMNCGAKAEDCGTKVVDYG